MGDLGPIDEDVRFDHEAAATLTRLCNAAAGVIEGQVGSRAGWTTTAQQDFAGYFSEVFARNQENAGLDASEVAIALRDVARQSTELAEAAESEQDRREKARAWQAEQDDKNWLERRADDVGDLFGGEDTPDVEPMPEPPNLDSTKTPPRPRETPRPGSGGGSASSGVSSARPSNLTTFANGARGANGELTGKPGPCKTAYDAFVSGCGWGSLSADSVFDGFRKYVDANVEDVEWASTVATAFEQAGSEGAVSTLSNSSISAALESRGIDASRQDVAVDPPVAIGKAPTSGYADDPVNAATGNFLENEVDLSFAGGCASLSLPRTYNSFDTGTGAFGPGWSSWTEAGLELTDDAARMRLEDGRVVVFPRLGEGWDRGTGESRWLAHEDTAEGRRLVASTNDGERRVHTTDGQLLEVSRGAGTRVSLDRDESGRVVRISHERGRSIELARDDDTGRVVRALASDGRAATYDYDDAGRLVATSTAGGTRTYQWDDSHGGPGLISGVLDADGVVEAENTYDDRGRVTAQRSAHGRISRYAYLDGNVTVVSDPDGTRSNTWISDARGRLIGAVDSDEQRQSFAYDTYGNRVMVTERDGSVTVREYDTRGRLVREVTPSGADLTYGYDEHDRVTTIVTETGAVTEYEYDADSEQRNPVVLTDPEGGRTAYTWADGLLTRVVDPTDVAVELEYDEHGDLVATTNAAGDTARLERDVHGRVVAAVTPLGHRTSYTYAASGLLSSRRDPDGAVWHYEHTAGGRLSAIVDPTGARTEVEHNDAGDAARTIDPLGRSITRHFDDLGNLTSAELPDGSTWQFAHDAMSRLTSTTTPDGATWTREYDQTGALTASVGPTGQRIGVTSDRATGTVTVDDGTATVSTRLDELGRPVSQGAADGSAVMSTYDRCGRVVEQLDADGGLTRIERDAAGKPVAVTSPAGVSTTYEYDACGRLAATVDATGARTTRGYDADGRLTTLSLPTGEVATTDHDACGRVVATRQPGRGVSRFRYDPAGRVVESSDTWSGRRRFRYDDAGQLVAVVNGNGGTTRYDYDSNGRAVAITDPLGGVTRREFDAMNRCTAETDPLGRTTRAGYDAAGRIAWQTDPDGHTTTWTYDQAGRLAETAVDGRVVSSVTRDIRGRKATISDRTRDGDACTVELAWNRRGQLVSRSRRGRTISYGYDADGRRTSLTTPDGVTSTYTYDPAGRLAAVDHPVLGRASFTRDASGRLVEATADGFVQTWEHTDGYVTAHAVGSESGFTRTEIHRELDGSSDPGDDVATWGRISGLTNEAGHTTYTYDEACQLIEARTGGSVHHWRYDAGGRLVAETVDGLTVEHAYDAAGQLVTSTDSERVTTYTYDGAGRRIREDSSDGMRRELVWRPTGWLDSVTDHLPGGDIRRTETHVDATGLLAEVDGTEIDWDTTGYAPVPVQAGDAQILAAGPVTGIGDAWTTPGWRTHRSTGADPWSATGAEASAGPASLPEAVSIGTDGGLSVAGMEWLGARVYDPASRGFLSVDPLEPVTGAGWAANPYSYAGNDPLHALDPRGLQPLTDEDLRAYNASQKGVFGHVGDFVKNNWEYIAGGAMVLGGAALMFAPIPGAQIVGAGLISAGADTIIQKATTGEVNWGQVAVNGAAGMVGGGVGSLAAKGGMTLARSTALSGVVEGGLSGGGSYLTGPGPHTPTGMVRNTMFGAGTGAIQIPGGAGNDIAQSATRNLGDVPPTPRVDESVQLFRNVDGPEFDSIAETGRFSTGPGMMEGKWFATTGADADQWGRQLNGGQGLTVETRVPREVADQLHHESGKLDGIGPGYYADESQLDLINDSMDGIRIKP